MPPTYSSFRREVGLFPRDLAITIGITLALNGTVFLPVIRNTPLRIPIGLVFVCFVPGYALVAALYPERSPTMEQPSGRESESLDHSLPPDGRLTYLERFVLAVGVSITIIPMIGYLFNFTRWGVHLTPILLCTSLVTIFASLVAAFRRQRLPEEERFQILLSDRTTGDAATLTHDGSAEFALNAVLIASVVFLAVSAGYVATTPSPDNQYSSLSLLTEEDGELLDEGYLTEFDANDSREIAFAVENHEQRPVNYTVIVVKQEIEKVDNETVVRDQRELDRFERKIGNDETWEREHELEPTMTRQRVRVAWLLYVNDVPSEPSIDNSDYDVSLQISVNETDDADASDASQ